MVESSEVGAAIQHEDDDDEELDHILEYNVREARKERRRYGPFCCL